MNAQKMNAAVLIQLISFRRTKICVYHCNIHLHGILMKRYQLLCFLYLFYTVLITLIQLIYIYFQDKDNLLLMRKV